MSFCLSYSCTWSLLRVFFKVRAAHFCFYQFNWSFWGVVNLPKFLMSLDIPFLSKLHNFVACHHTLLCKANFYVSMKVLRINCNVKLNAVQYILIFEKDNYQLQTATRSPWNKPISSLYQWKTIERYYRWDLDKPLRHMRNS